jgi:hypothetical protein
MDSIGRVTQASKTTIMRETTSCGLLGKHFGPQLLTS